MLIFKHNIYEKQCRFRSLSNPEPAPPLSLEVPKFINNAFQDDLHFFDLMERTPGGALKEDMVSFFPNANHFGNKHVIKSMLNSLQAGLNEKDTWYRMNTYHLCLVFDSLYRHAYNYNHDSDEEKVRSYPETRGQPIPFDYLLERYFFNTVFLLSQEKYNALTGEDKKQLGYTCPCQFGVIHGLAPTAEEMELKVEPGFPYSIFV